MPRVKRGVTTHHRHKKLLVLTKGHRASRHALYRRAHESMLHALSYAYAHRRERKGDMRRLWISRVNAASRLGGITYGQLINGLKKSGIEIQEKESERKDERLKGKIFALTGILRSSSREKTEEKIRELGGKTASSVSRKTDFLIVGEKPGTKLKEAEKFGVPLLSENDFLKMLK